MNISVRNTYYYTAIHNTFLVYQNVNKIRICATLVIVIANKPKLTRKYIRYTHIIMTLFIFTLE